MQPLWQAHGLSAPPFAGTYEHLYVDMYPEGLKAYGNEHIPHIVKVRPHDPAPAAETTGPPVVYVTFGTERIASREDVQFWIEWIDKLIARVNERGNFTKPEQRQEVVNLFRRGQEVYRGLLK